MKNEILVVGDTHGEWDKLNILINKKRPSIVLQCGDFGWWPALETKRKIKDGTIQKAWKLDGVKSQGSKIYWCDGNHEDHYALQNFPGFKERSPIQLYEGVYFMPRGSILQLPDGRTVMFIGGADSIDKHWRTQGISWFKEELINYEQQNHILSYEGKVDIVISHTCPLEWQPRPCFFGKDADPTRRVLSAVLEKYSPEKWFHGHWHEDKEGRYGNTIWRSLSCPQENGRWWDWLD